MPFDPQWTKPRDVADITFADFVAWLKTKDPDEEYDWYSTDRCAVGQFLTDMTGSDDPGSLIIYDALFGGWDYERIAGDKPRTFGGALARARTRRRAS